MKAARRGASNLLKMMTGHLATLIVVTVSGVVVPRVLGARAYGQYAAVLAVVAILQSVSSLGLAQVEMRFLPPLWRLPDRSRVLALASSIWTVRLVLGVAVGVAGFFWLGSTVAADQSVGIVLGLGLLCTLRSAQEATRGLFLPIGHIGKLKAFEFLHAVLRLPLVAGGFLAFGLAGVFAALPGLQAVIWCLTTVVLSRLLPIRPAHCQWSALRPYLSFGLLSFVGLLCTVLQVQFSIYAVAHWVTEREAGYLAVAMQLYVLPRGLFLSARRSLMPILAELEAAGEKSELTYWGSLMMRYSAAASCLLATAWVAIGEGLVRGLLGSQFAPVYPVVAILLVSVVLFACGASCNALVYIHGRAGFASLNALIHTLGVIGGLTLALSRGDAGAAERIAWCYIWASGLFFVGSYLSLGWLTGVWLPLRRTLLLILPSTLVMQAISWDLDLGTRWFALLVFAVGYGVLVVGFKLLPRNELRKISQVLKRDQKIETPTKHDAPGS